ncbi:nitrogenase cofactor biosynthesis protein NifB [Desulfosarcina alkanivorans]|uniref:FeMo cofactor biosynthesis protein NifB n=1 Tax=Desulfosarcina alkanivorans TaxID=571177 RepID=A0A5K7YPC7_9BACT|nr:nitrogenase cofactor biosynthesis protein NifB [Desulfosarcina alkanivorans]BBO71066.1 nitrogenase cofactor biosynthesis protein NifB [Desulfosarcina alkanivorans]
MNLDNHPCFNPGACKSFGRVHLPVAPRCNIQCKFCNRRFDCVNETRPGVTSAVLSPGQAMVYLEEVFALKGNIAVVGIAGPGDPFANPEETLETLSRVRSRYPEVMLCVATNGLNLEPYLDEIKRLDVSHVTVTVNAVDPAIGEQIYSWMRVGKRVLRAREGAAVLLERQLAAIKGLKDRGIMVKANSIILPGINEGHIEAVARRMADLEVDLFNAMPYYPNAGSEFEHLAEPETATVENIRAAAAVHVKQMRHCTRCRADAVGLLGEPTDDGLMNTLSACRRLDVKTPRVGRVSPRPCVAVASMEGVLVNQHLGEADKLLVYGEKEGRIQLLEARATPARGGYMKRWQEMADTFSDCSTLLVSGVGANPLKVLSAAGIEVLEIEGLIDEAVRAVFAGERLNHMVKRSLSACGEACHGNGMGCG